MSRFLNYNNDSPLTLGISHQQDELGRLKIAKAFKEIIDFYKEGRIETSRIIAIRGEWGEGKTSFIHLIRDFYSSPIYPSIFKRVHLHLLKRILLPFKKSLSIFKEPPAWIFYDPWDWSQDHEIYNSFFNSLSTQLPNVSIKRAFRKVYKTYINNSRPPTFFTILRPILDHFYPRLSPEEEKNLLKKQLQKRESPIIIVIDNLDRINTGDIIKVFRFVKMYLDLPNLIFFITYDQKIIEKALTDERNAYEGKEYLRKFIHLTFDLPKVSEPQMCELFIKLMKDIFSQVEVGRSFEEQLRSLYKEKGLGNYISNLRHIKNLSNNVQLTFMQMPKSGRQLDYNAIDFIAIEAIRVFDCTCYNILRRHKFYLTNSDNKHTRNHIQEDPVEGLDLQLSKREETVKILKFLFPILEEPLFGRENDPEAFKNSRICSSEHFDRYFSFTLDPTSLTIMKFNEWIRDIENPKKFRKIFEKFYNKGKGENAINNLANKFKEENCEYENLNKAFLSIFEIFNVIAEFYDSSYLSQFYKIIREICWKEKEIYKKKSNYETKELYSESSLPEKLFKAFALAIRKSENLILIVDIWPKLGEESPPIGDLIKRFSKELKEEVEERLKKLFISQIEKYINSPIICHLARIWEDIDKKQKNEWVKSLCSIEKKKKLISFLKYSIFLHKSNLKEFNRLDGQVKKQIKDFGFDPQELKKILKNIGPDDFTSKDSSYLKIIIEALEEGESADEKIKV